MFQKYRLIFARQAKIDINQICTTVAVSSPQGAETLAKKLDRSFQSVSDLPHANRVYEQRRDPALSVRRHVQWPYLIYYRINEVQKLVTVLTIRHGARRQPKRFRR